MTLMPLLFGSGAESPSANTKADEKQCDPDSIQIDVIIARVERVKGKSFQVDRKRNVRLKIHGGSKSATAFGGVVGDASVYLESLKALEAKGMGEVVSQPRLITRSGQAASFFDGREASAPVPAQRGQVAFGSEEGSICLEFLATALDDGRIRLGVGVEINSSSVGKEELKADTTVEMEAGQAFVLGGIMQKAPRADAEKSPQGNATRETELVILVTPRLIGVPTERLTRRKAAPVPTNTLTIANVFRQQCWIFTYDDKGNLVFECKLYSGTAVDVKSAPGQRWTAFFNPDDLNSATLPGEAPPKAQLVNHKAGGADSTWLLREAPKR